MKAYFRALSVALLMILSITLGAQALADQSNERHKIIYLLDAVSSSHLIFIRNGHEYSGQEARAHLEEKMEFFGNPTLSANDFIDQVASQSSTTHSPYYVRFADGSQIKANIWLQKKLAEMK